MAKGYVNEVDFTGMGGISYVLYSKLPLTKEQAKERIENHSIMPGHVDEVLSVQSSPCDLYEYA